MNPTPTSELYDAVLVPALQRIQREFGYLQREALEQYSQESGIPLPRLHEVASFFPHFQLAPPKKVVLKVCRDMSCRMAGSGEMINQLQGMVGPDVGVEGVSCLGRCDRAPAACVATLDSEHEHLYAARSTEDLKEVIKGCLAGHHPKADHDADRATALAGALVNPYGDQPSDYQAVAKAIVVRNEALRRGTTILAEEKGWDPARIEQFRQGVIGQGSVASSRNPQVAEAIIQWHTEDQWAAGPTLGGWTEVLLNEIKDADLRGMGGAGIPSVQKLRDVRDAVRTARKRASDDRAFIVVNGDESEPATFKDRELLLETPHIVLEGVILAGLITGASQGFIYIRHEYPEQIEACRAEIARAEKLGWCGTDATMLGRSFPVSVFVSPGGYICGEQSALIEAMSDRRGEPRNMPPKLETNGLINLPTLVSNVETFSWMPYICLKGGKTYAGLGVNGWKGRRIFSISGDVKRPGVYEVPMGMTLRELVYGEQYCQGIVGDRALKALAPSGPSGGFLPAKLTVGGGLPREHTKNKSWLALAERRGFDPNATELDILDLELELNLFRALSPTQALGAGMVVYAEGRDMVEEACNSLQFFRNESCGKCVPCRSGSQKLASLSGRLAKNEITAQQWDETLWPLVQDMGKAIELASICGLGRSVPVPLRTVNNYFPQDLRQHLSGTKGAPETKR